MSAYYYGPQHHQPSSASSHSSSSSHNHHGGRSRRAPRLSASQNSHRPFRGVRSMKELTESPPTSAFRLRFEAGRSFDLDDDLEFCPGLLTEDDVSLNVRIWPSFSYRQRCVCRTYAYPCLPHSYNLFTHPRPTVPSPVVRLTHRHSSRRSSLSNKSILASPFPPLHQTTHTTLSLVSSQTIVSR